MGPHGFFLFQVGMFYNYEKKKKKNNQNGTEEMAQ